MIVDAFPSIDDKLLKKIGVTSSELQAVAKNESGELPIQCNQESALGKTTVWQLEHPSWHPETHDLTVGYDLTIQAPIFLFGPYGLAASEGSVIGMAVQWTDAEASQRGCVTLGELAASDRRHPWRVTGAVTLPRGILRGTLRLYLVLFLREAGNPRPEESYLARTPGTVFGTLHEDRLTIDGNGAIFPVRQIRSEHAPLWRLICDWDDPADPVSEETVCLELNQAHRDYAALYDGDKGGWSPLMREVLAGALQVLLTRAASRLDSAGVHDGQNMPEGSIGQLVFYMQKVYGLSADAVTASEDPEILASQLRLALDRQM